MASIFGRDTRDTDRNGKINTIAAYRLPGGNNPPMTAGRALGAERAAKLKEQRRDKKLFEAMVGMDQGTAENTETTKKTLDFLQKARINDNAKRDIEAARAVRDKKRNFTLMEKINKNLSIIADVAVWQRLTGMMKMGAGVAGGLGAAAAGGARGLSSLMTGGRVTGRNAILPAFKSSAGMKGASKFLNIGGRFAVGGLGAITGIGALADGYSAIRSKQGQSFFGDAQGEQGFWQSKAMDYLMNAGTSGLAGAAIGSAIPVVGTGVGAVVGAGVGVVTSLYADFKEEVDATLARVGNFIKNADFPKMGRELAKFLRTTLTDGIAKGADVLKHAVTGTIGIIGEWGPVLVKQLGGFIFGVVDELTGGTLTNLGNWWRDNAAPWINETGAFIGKKVDQILSTIKGWMENIFNSIVDLIPNADRSRLMDSVVSGDKARYEKALAGADIGLIMAARKSSEAKIADYDEQIARMKQSVALDKSGRNQKPMLDKIKRLEEIRANYAQSLGIFDDALASRSGGVLGSGGGGGIGNMMLPNVSSLATQAAGASVMNTVNAAAYIPSQITDAARLAGVNPNYLLQLAKKESGLNPLAKAAGSSATGLFQILTKDSKRRKSTWSHYFERYGDQFGLSNNPMDVRSNSVIAALLTKENADYLRKRLGREPTAEELRLAHFLGAGSAYRFLSEMKINPNGDPSASFAREAAANRSVFEGGTYSDVYRKLTKGFSKRDLSSLAIPGAMPTVDATKPAFKPQQISDREAVTKVSSTKNIPTASPWRRSAFTEIPFFAGGEDTGMMIWNVPGAM